MISTNEKEPDIFDVLEKNSPENKHRVFWADLYDKLLDDEARSIDSIMEKVTYRPGQVIYSQGVFDRNLYFLEVGQAKHIYTHYGQEVFIKKIQPGSVAGGDHFFDGGCCTTSLVAIDPVKVRFMSAERLANEICCYDVLKGRLKNFCAKEVKIRDLLNRNAQDRRQHNRYGLQGPILIKDIDGVAGLDARTLKGGARNLSCGGMAVEVELERSDQAQALLRNNLKVRFNLPPHMTAIVERICQVLRIRNKEESVVSPEGKKRYLLNMKFNEQLTGDIIAEYARYFKMINSSQS